VIVGHEDRVTPWSSFPHYGCVRVRVWQRLTPFGFFQRHEWERKDGSVIADEWIPAPTRRFDARATPADDPHDPASALVDALRRIAAGHNDPRTLAAETLSLIGSPA
jgi:hypothetical protein